MWWILSVRIFPILNFVKPSHEAFVLLLNDAIFNDADCANVMVFGFLWKVKFVFSDGNRL